MIGAKYPVVDLAGSDRNLGRSLSPVVAVVAESPSVTPRCHRVPPWKPVAHLPSRRFLCSAPRHQPQKTIQYPEPRPGSVQ
jgi:hypothetical protein